MSRKHAGPTGPPRTAETRDVSEVSALLWFPVKLTDYTTQDSQLKTDNTRSTWINHGGSRCKDGACVRGLQQQRR